MNTNDSIQPAQTVSLSSFDWHLVLAEMEHAMEIVGRDKVILEKLYCKMASQLAGHPVRFAKPEVPQIKFEMPPGRTLNEARGASEEDLRQVQPKEVSPSQPRDSFWRRCWSRW